MFEAGVFSHVLEWLATPATWVAVLLPAAVAAYVFRTRGPTRMECLLVLAGIVVTHFSSELVENGPWLELHSTSLFPMALVVLAGLRLYPREPLRVFALTWLVYLVADFSAVIWLSQDMAGIRLPVGIGGAGLGDALLVEPAIAALGVWLLGQAQRRAQAGALPGG